jgi:hypothetical protein
MAETHHTPAAGHEESDVNIRAIFAFGLGLLAVAIVIHALMWLLFMYFAAQDRVAAPHHPLASVESATLPPEPRLQITPRQDLLDLRAQEAQVLGSYGWVDRNTGVVRIPIDEAMRLTLQRGLPARPSPGGAK